MPFLTKDLKELLVTGFIRRNTNDGGNNYSSFSSLFIEEIYSHLNDKIVWKIGGEEMRQCSSAIPEQSFSSSIIKFDGIEFRLRIFPKGRARHNDNYISMNIELISKPKGMNFIDTFTEIHIGNDSIFKSNIKYTSKCRGNKNEKDDKIEDGPNHKKKDDSQCLGFKKVETTLKWSDYIHLDLLSISIEIKILETKCCEKITEERCGVDKNNKLRNYCTNFETMQFTKYKWKINENILRQFKCLSNLNKKEKIRIYENEENNTIYDKYNFIDKLNKNWIMSITYDSFDENCLLGLHLAFLPSIIDKMNIRCRISIDFDDFDLNESQSVIQINNIGLIQGRIKTITFKHPKIKKKINSITEMYIKWDVAILQCFDKNGNLIFNDPNHESILLNESLNA